MTRGRILHVLSQRPSLTGSGVTLDALVRLAAERGWEQRVVVGVPAGEPLSGVGDLPASQVAPLTFGRPEANLPFPVPGMSDAMPYESTVFSQMTGDQLEQYRIAWRRHLAAVVSQFEPHLIHGHHAWLVGAALKDVAPDIPVVTHGHGTGLRQRLLCPHLADEVRAGVGRNERVLALFRAQARDYGEALAMPPERVAVIGAGYREDLFLPGPAGVGSPAPNMLYAGKLSAAKGLPWLLDAVARLAESRPGAVLHVAGSGAGDEAELLRERMAAMAPAVVTHGQVNQASLARLMRQCQVFVLPSMFEGLPLVLVEALACGCRPVCTDLPGVREELAPVIGDALVRVPLPRLRNVDQPEPADLPAFVDHLTVALGEACDLAAERGPPRIDLSSFTWGAVFARVEAIWGELIAGPQAAH